MATILIVDDHPDSRDVLGEILRMHGHDVDMTDSAELAWKSVQQSPPDVIVVDQRLPGIQGIELVKRIRARPDFSDMSVVLCSADDSEREAATAAGANGFWLKGSAGIFDAVAQLSDRLNGNL